MINKDELYKFYEGESGKSQSQLYDVSTAAKRRMKTLKEMMSGRIENKIIMDLGCFNGVYTKWISEKARMVVGVDISPTKIARCPKLPNGIFIIADWEDLPMTKDTFDAILLSEGLEHAIDPRKLIEKCMVLSDSLIASIPLNENPTDNPLTENGNGHLHTFTSGQVNELITGYEIENYLEDEDHAYFVIRRRY